ncbi:hypothetical protein AU152_gp31 [Mycobacterium phage Phlei]|uniref:Uncharacterized protein n=1 Tax=Mycobacterium phage Phlei TaxID=1690684 RepID=A0A0N9BDM8_9CAUD|nr:hypothetical protein AU152_gp31 [Mycobacterium phage Phlei]ALA48144.1 hypothetical protein [Mycobacterium phage Phlei]
MTEQQDHEFFDLLYQQWAQTTGAGTTYWMPEEVTPPSICETDHGLDGFVIWAVDAVDTTKRELVASHLSSEDADFICGMHGALPDLIRALHDAIDEAKRKDLANDEAQEQLADALLENIGLQAEILELERQLGSN